MSRYDGQTFTTFTTEDGLTSNSVRSLMQDREGQLWFGTEGGASRYDGQTFTTYTPHNEVNSLLVDREGQLWFATWGDGVSRYDGQTFTTFTTEDGLASNWVWFIREDLLGAAGAATAEGPSSI